MTISHHIDCYSSAAGRKCLGPPRCSALHRTDAVVEVHDIQRTEFRCDADAAPYHGPLYWWTPPSSPYSSRSDNKTGGEGIQTHDTAGHPLPKRAQAEVGYAPGNDNGEDTEGTLSERLSFARAAVARDPSHGGKLLRLKRLEEEHIRYHKSRRAQ